MLVLVQRTYFLNSPYNHQSNKNDLEYSRSVICFGGLLSSQISSFNIFIILELKGDKIWYGLRIWQKKKLYISHISGSLRDCTYCPKLPALARGLASHSRHWSIAKQRCTERGGERYAPAAQADAGLVGRGSDVADHPPLKDRQLESLKILLPLD